jgi:predicted ester cyclase
VSEALTLVRRFYAEVWDAHDHAAAPSILDPDFRFRGSLGAEKRGIAGFFEYVDGIHAALGDYRCEIVDAVEAGDRVAARMRFHGLHRDPFMGFAPTGRRVEWAGAAFFTVARGRIAALWVLGDLDALKSQLAAAAG